MYTNKEKRSFVLSCVLGDGCLSVNKTFNTGKFSMKHGIKQLDYLNWKVNLINQVLNAKVTAKPTKSYVDALKKTYDQYQAQYTRKKFRAWRKFFYKNNIKQIGKILKFIKHPGLALAVWMMDDGSCVNPKKKNGTRVFCGLVLYVCDQDKENCQEIVDWLKLHFNVNPKVKWQKLKYKGAIRFYPKVTFNNQDSIIIWKHMEPFVSQIPSMKEKFLGVDIRSKRSDLLQPQILFS